MGKSKEEGKIFRGVTKYAEYPFTRDVLIDLTFALTVIDVM